MASGWVLGWDTGGAQRVVVGEWGPGRRAGGWGRGIGGEAGISRARGSGIVGTRVQGEVKGNHENM